MNAKELINGLKTVKINKMVIEYNYSQDLVKYIAKKEKIKILNNIELDDLVNELKNFDINLVWECSFWKLKPMDSICAVATEVYQSLKKIRNT